MINYLNLSPKSKNVYLASSLGMMIDVKIIVENAVNVFLVSPMKKKNLLKMFPVILLVFL